MVLPPQSWALQVDIGLGWSVGYWRSYWPFSETLQRQTGGIVSGLRLLLGSGHWVGSSQTGVRQVAVYVEEGRVVLPVADVGKDQPNYSSNKGICGKDHLCGHLCDHL